MISSASDQHQRRSCLLCGVEGSFTVHLNHCYTDVISGDLPQITCAINTHEPDIAPKRSLDISSGFKLFTAMFGNGGRSFQSSSLCNNTGFLQKNNNVDDKSRIVGVFNDQQPKSILTRDNERDPRFRRTETDFSNLYARGEWQSPLSSP